jgi:hypothetical protein
MSVEDVESEDALEHAGEEISREESRGSLGLWFGVLGSPLAWGGHLMLNYSLEEWFACSESADKKGEILGIGVKTVSVALNSAMLAIAVLSGLVAFSCWRKLRGRQGDERLDRAQWMAFAGMVECALFTGIILLGYLPNVFLHASCETTP